VQSLPVYPVADHLKLESPAKPIVVETAASEVKAEWKILTRSCNDTRYGIEEFFDWIDVGTYLVSLFPRTGSRLKPKLSS
jgi:hypothetical protein